MCWGVHQGQAGQDTVDKLEETPGGTTYGMGRREDDVDGDGRPVNILGRACFQRKSDRRGRCTHVQALPVDGLDGRLDRWRGRGWEDETEGGVGQSGWTQRRKDGTQKLMRTLRDR